MSKLYIVPTPIGNLKDITFRAVETLNNVDLILAEDTRTSGKLLNHYEIKTPMVSYHMHNEHRVLESVIEKIQSGLNIAIISDAGTPAISDPGFLLVRECVENQIEVDCLPGATALIPALVNSGFPNDKFVFEGFLPVKKGRQTRFKKLVEEKRTIILYESPHKLLKTLREISLYMGEDTQLSISREISKLYEETLRGTSKELEDYFNKNKPKGEIVIIIQRHK
ncbi:16S rRNA (cytidine(1402)-2'-O)-methyltransferase [Flavobacteriaceae bacterium]|nr:16S rRNA (cytidine(1402)-2'-O)-methyltransferase [Flavobacteriaceae bacterium]MDC1492708.1 16S rRNA (cytidine(1402)-2'-O)-methyltransferase [Flavobacteriaceae bacterium]MDC1534727.1 16S rRNA (cytidine(1402)-2'-O)-methyltransferase [Flavobacteriaceae bacterium]